MPIQFELIQLFEENVNKFPDSIAAVYQNVSLSYSELNKKVNQCANYLLLLNKDNQSYPKIGLFGQNKLNMLVLQLAILKINGSFIPLDPDTPVKRLEYMIGVSDLALLINCDEIVLKKEYQLLFEEKQLEIVQSFVEFKELIQECDSANLDRNINGESPAYILFTSGSTAKSPKGVVQSQRGIMEQITNYSSDLCLTKQDKFLQLATFMHDQSIVDIYAALLNGGALYLYDVNNNLDIDDLRNFIKNNEITIFSSIPSLYELIFSDIRPDFDLPNLRIITTGGEETKVRHAQLYQFLCKQGVLDSKICLFVNGYGATEYSWIAFFTVTPYTDLSDMQTLPLGSLSQGIEYSIINDEELYLKGQGELCVIGKGSAQRYIGDDAANTAFESLNNGKTLYHTGDVVNIDENGIIIFVGRTKWHAKINGKRINLHEIEVAILEVSHCREVAVFLIGENPHQKLVACLEADMMDDNKKNEIKKSLVSSNILPDYMIPTYFHVEEQFKQLPNGKLDRQFLLQSISSLYIPSVMSEFEHQSSENNLNNLLQSIKDLWREELGCEISEDNNFFALGGTSLNAFRIIVKIKEILYTMYDVNLELSAALIYEYDTATLFYGGILKHYYNSLKGLIKELPPYPIVQKFPVILTMYNQAKSVNVEYIAEGINTISLNFEALCVIADYYNNKYNIRMLPCESHTRFFGEIIKFLEEDTLESQIGLIFTRIDGNKNSHFIPCIVNIDRQTKEIYLFISDSVGISKSDFLGLEMVYYNSTKLRNLKIKIYTDKISNRQTDFYSCSIDALCYLKEALRIENFKETVMNTVDNEYIDGNSPFWKGRYASPSNVLKGYQFSDNDGSYRQAIGLEDDRIHCNDYPFFRSTMESFSAEINMHEAIENTKKSKSLSNFYKENSKLCLFRPFTYVRTSYYSDSHYTQLGDPALDPPVTVCLNTYYYSKATLFQAIINSERQEVYENADAKNIASPI